MIRIRLLLALLACQLTFAATTAVAQEESSKGFRKLAPGVETTITLDIEEEETVAPHKIVEVLAVPGLKWEQPPYSSPETKTLFDKAQDVNFRRQVQGLDFTFKPLRMIYVDIPQPSGKMQRKLIWYMVYRVTNRGGHMQPKQKADGTFEVETIAKPFRFIPQFILETREFDGGPKEYLDRLIPVAIGPIQQREDPNRRLLNTVEISTQVIPLSDERTDRSVWGVVTWEDVDPRIDYFSVYIAGLTDAYRWVDRPGVYKHGDNVGKGRVFQRKYLQLFFWRPGDEYDEHENEVRYGMPRLDDSGGETGPQRRLKLYGIEPEGIDYQWLYR